MYRRFLFGLANGMLPIARIMAVELLGPEHAVIGMAFLPGERQVIRYRAALVHNR